MDNCVERDGHCRRAIPTWITPADLADCLQHSEASTRQYLVIDMRSFSLYCGKHIKSAQSLSFSPILIRRILKGAISLDSLITDEQLLSSITSAELIVMYDSCSTPASPKQELQRFVEMLKARHHNKEFKTLLGGMETFQATYPELCQSETAGKAVSPTKITLDTSVMAKSAYHDTPEGTPVEILPYLYLGSAKDSSDLRVLKKMDITAVLNITTTCPNYFESLFEYLSIPVEDSHQTDLLSRLQKAIAFIDEVQSKGGRVFVHCHAGISRSATVCIAYLMQQKRMTLNDAYSFVKSRRPIISPNLHFMGQLMVYQQNLMTIWNTQSHQTTTTTTVTSTSVSPSCTYVTKDSIPLQSTDTSPLSQQHVISTDISNSSPETITDSLPTTTNTESFERGPSFRATGRSVSLPLEHKYTTVSNSVIQRPKKSREGLKLSLNNDCSRRKSSPQISPCRVEVMNPLTLSLTLPTTCT